jgi:hypothetical protein
MRHREGGGSSFYFIHALQQGPLFEGVQPLGTSHIARRRRARVSHSLARLVRPLRPDIKTIRHHFDRGQEKGQADCRYPLFSRRRVVYRGASRTLAQPPRQARWQRNVAIANDGARSGSEERADTVLSQPDAMVKCGAGTNPASSLIFLRSATSLWSLGTASSCHLCRRRFGGLFKNPSLPRYTCAARFP